MKIYLLIICALLFACQSQKGKASDKQTDPTKQEEVCIAFDQRQCQTDAFATYLTQAKSSDAMFQGMQSYLTDIGIKVVHMRIDMNFHEFTCAACDVCPEQHRFFISTPTSEVAKLAQLKLLNFSKVSCSELF